MAMSVGAPTQDPTRRRRAACVLVAVGAVILLVSPVAGQSADPSIAPGPSVAPAASVAPSAGATALDPLQLLEATLAAQACDPLLTTAEVAAAAGSTVSGPSGGHVEPGADSRVTGRLDCSWTVGGGTVTLKVEDRAWKGKGKPKTKDFWDAFDRGFTPDATKLPGPGDAAFSDAGSSGGFYPGKPNVTWSTWLKDGKRYTDRWAGLVSDSVDVAVLEALAAIVRSNAAPGARPAPIPPGDAAASLLGSWTMPPYKGMFGDASPITMTVTFDESGTVTSTFDCRRDKGKKPLAITDLYFVDGADITIVQTGAAPRGGCSITSKDGSFDVAGRQGRETLLKGLRLVTSANDATWVVDGDTLTITIMANGEPVTVILQRAAG